MTVLGLERSDIREGALLGLCDAHHKRHLSRFWRCSWSRTFQQQNRTVSLLCSGTGLILWETVPGAWTEHKDRYTATTWGFLSSVRSEV